METDEIRDILEPMVEGTGVRLVELTVGRSRGSVQARLVVYRPEGTGIDECSKVHRLVMPKLAELLGTDDFHFEVMSPGLDRHIKDAREYGIFAGRGVKVLEKDTDLWIGGKITGTDPGGVTIATASGDRRLAFDAIAKARLDYSQEGA